MFPYNATIGADLLEAGNSTAFGTFAPAPVCHLWNSSTMEARLVLQERSAADEDWRWQRPAVPMKPRALQLSNSSGLEKLDDPFGGIKANSLRPRGQCPQCHNVPNFLFKPSRLQVKPRDIVLMAFPRRHPCPNLSTSTWRVWWSDKSASLMQAPYYHLQQ